MGATAADLAELSRVELEPAGHYFAHGGRLCRRRNTKDGEVIDPLCNFTARVVEEIVSSWWTCSRPMPASAPRTSRQSPWPSSPSTARWWPRSGGGCEPVAAAQRLPASRMPRSHPRRLRLSLPPDPWALPEPERIAGRCGLLPHSGLAGAALRQEFVRTARAKGPPDRLDSRWRDLPSLWLLGPHRRPHHPPLAGWQR
jgi:hypothetical protein